MEVRRVQDDSEIDAALDLRRRVFCGEQGVPLEIERDGLDPEAIHLVAVEDGRVVGTCRLVIRDGVARLGRMAVEPGRRGEGLGAAILSAAEAEARAAGALDVRLHAQLDARALYERGGYVRHGAEFMEAGIAHVPMEKRLA